MLDPLSSLLLTLGAALLVSRLARVAGGWLHVPQVTLLIVFGVTLGPAVLDVLPEARARWYPGIAEATLAMVGFLLGGEFTLAGLRERGRSVLILSLTVTLASWLVVALGAWALTGALPVSLVLACAATATDPAACQNVVRESGAEGPLSRTLLGVVAVDDLWGILVFSATLAGLGLMTGEGGGEALTHGLLELGGSLTLGATLGLVMSLVTGRLIPGQPTREEAVGFVLVSAGLAHWLGLSYLLVAVTMGAVVANLATHHERTFRQIEDIEWPFLVIFFILSGAILEPTGVAEVALLTAVYVLCRVAGRALGAWAGSRLLGWTDSASLGPALLPQAGVALGMTLVATERFASIGQQALTVIVLSTVFFEVVGPLLTLRQLRRAEELGEAT
ncbi:MAG: cation:proton antiporter [Alphaproteobacteria bacterium]|nr:cation:proton antiporter [Alphaproteobacteria bacterium]